MNPHDDGEWKFLVDIGTAYSLNWRTWKEGSEKKVSRNKRNMIYLRLRKTLLIELKQALLGY